MCYTAYAVENIGMEIKIERKTWLRLHIPVITMARINRIAALCMGLSIVIFVFDSLMPLGVAGGVPYILVVLVSLWSPNKRLPIYVAIGVSILTLTGIHTSPSGGELWKVVLNRALALFAIWTTAVLATQRISMQREREEALSRLKVLSGMLPICASCKKIRDDKGYWNQIETYIRAHSEAEFSHGICPDCTKKLYPNLTLKSRGKVSSDQGDQVRK